jgi:hypothetical protein
VTAVIDPFTEFDPAYPPEEGGRYVAVNVAFDADAGNRFDIGPSEIVLGTMPDSSGTRRAWCWRRMR